MITPTTQPVGNPTTPVTWRLPPGAVAAATPKFRASPPADDQEDTPGDLVPDDTASIGSWLSGLDCEQVGEQKQSDLEDSSHRDFSEEPLEKSEGVQVMRASDRFLQSLARADDQFNEELDLDVDALFDDSSESASEESSSDEEQTEELEIERSRNIVLQQFESASGFFINNKTNVLHRKRAAMVFACGRKISSAYTAVHELNGLRCGQCFNI